MIGAMANLPSTISDSEKVTLDRGVNTYNSQLKEKQTIVSKNALEEADFLALLVKQLQTQDPCKPMEDKEFMAQMAQLTSLKQMSSVAENMNNFVKQFDFTKSVSLVGKDVCWTDTMGNQHQGRVSSVLIKNQESYLNVNGISVSLDNITEVKESQVVVAMTENIT